MLDNKMMDNKPLPPLSSEAEPQAPAEAMGQEHAFPPLQIEPGAATGDGDSIEVGISPAAPSLSSPPASAVTRESALRNIFIGSEGIYPGTRWLIYLAMGFLIFQVEGWLVLPFRSHVSHLWWRVMTEGSMMLAAILPGFAMARIENHPFGDFGLPSRRAFRRNFWVGSLWGIVSLSVLMLALRVAGVFEFGGLALSPHGTRIWKFALYYAGFFLLTGFFEEFLLRGYTQWVLSRGMNFWPAAALLSISFGAIHGTNPGEAKTGLVAAGLIGFFLCLTLRRTGDLWWAVGFHMAWDWGESYLYSVPDSGTILPGHLLNSSLRGPDWLAGGSVGPEGSYLVFVVIGILWALFDRAYPEVKYGVSERN